MEEKLPFLERIIAQKRDIEEKKRIGGLALTIDALKIVDPRFSVSESYITGSFYQPRRFHSHSDIDITFANLTDQDYFTYIAAMQDILPFPVEVIELENCRFTDKVIEKGI